MRCWETNSFLPRNSCWSLSIQVQEVWRDNMQTIKQPRTVQIPVTRSYSFLKSRARHRFHLIYLCGKLDDVKKASCSCAHYLYSWYTVLKTKFNWGKNHKICNAYFEILGFSTICFAPSLVKGSFCWLLLCNSLGSWISHLEWNGIFSFKQYCRLQLHLHVPHKARAKKM